MQKKPVNMTFILLVLGGSLAFSFLSPLLMKSCEPKATMPQLTENVKKTYVDFIAGHRQDPAQYLVNAFADHDVVILGDLFSTNTYGFVRGLVPALYKKGVRAIGFQWAYAKDQALIDGLFAAAEYDENKAKDVLTTFFSDLAYPENLLFFRELWAFNHVLPAGAERLRVVALGPNVDVKIIQDEKYKDDKAARRRAYGGISMEEACFNTIASEIIAKNKKALLYMHTQLAFKKISLKTQIDEYAALDIPFKGPTAQQVAERINDRLLVVYIHNIWFLEGASSAVFPLEGMIDAVIRDLPADARQTVFTVAGSPFQDLPIKANKTDKDGKPVPFRDLCDAYILMGDLAGYKFSRFPEDSLRDGDVDKLLDASGTDRSKANVKTARDFIKIINEKVIDKVNAELAGLPH
jgi:hypothetical protein